MLTWSAATPRLSSISLSRFVATSALSSFANAVGKQAGFSSEQSFYRNFRKFAGMAPGEWDVKMRL
uniref:hypothetical protein n=1 Tax=Prevotella sp. TaxID=59823 RepID=UPI0040287172